jgi:folate-binding protein YgfZ
MSSNASPQSGLLPHLGVLRFTGPDSLSFLQGQVSNDTRRLAAGRGLLAAYSSPQGRVLALMHLLPHSSGTIAILPRELVLPTLEILRRFVLRAKVKMDDASEVLGISGQHGTHQLQSAGIVAPPTGADYAETADIGVGAVNHDAGRYWVVGAVDKLAERGLAEPGLAGDPLRLERVEQDWRFADIRAGLPQIYLATREAFVAQMLNLDLLDGISFSKGCYTGQEIIARTQHLGRIKRRLYRLQLPRGEWSIGQSLRLTDGRAGRLTEVIRCGDGAYEALAVLTMQKLSAADSSDGDSAASASDSGASASVAATQLPLPYELQSPLE